MLAARANRATIRKAVIVITFDSDPQSLGQKLADRLWITSGKA